MKEIKILILAKQDIYVEGLLRIIGDKQDITIVGCISPDQFNLESLNDTPFDLLIANVNLISHPFGHFFNQFKEINPDLKFLVFGQYLQDEMLINLIRSGASGYINENMTADNFIQSIYYVMEDRLWVERHILELLAKDALHVDKILEQAVTNKIKVLSNILTKKEAQVFQWILKGLSTKEVGEKIYMSEQSVKAHLGKLFKKMGVTNRTHLVMSFYEKVSPISNFNPLIQMTLEKRALSYKLKKQQD